MSLQYEKCFIFPCTRRSGCLQRNFKESRPEQASAFGVESEAAAQRVPPVRSIDFIVLYLYFFSRTGCGGGKR